MDLTSWLKRVVFYRMDITFSQAFAYWNEIARDYTIKNREAVWIDPMDYQAELTQAVLELRDWRMDVPIFNLPRCPPPEALWPFARKSISDWKTQYLDICRECAEQPECCGLFATSRIQSRGIKVIK